MNRPSLHHLNFVNILFNVWTPSSRGVLKLGPNDSVISRLKYARMSSFYIPFQETKIFCAFVVILSISNDALNNWAQNFIINIIMELDM